MPATAAGALAIRPASRSSTPVRAAAIALLSVVAVVGHESLAALLLPFLALPAIGAADAIALRLRVAAER